LVADAPTSDPHVWSSRVWAFSLADGGGEEGVAGGGVLFLGGEDAVEGGAGALEGGE
jgi:hypothetical protein